MTCNTKSSDFQNTERRGQICKMLRRKNGATTSEIQSVFGWQAHSARAAISGLRKAGFTVERITSPKGSIYRIVTMKTGSANEG